MVVHIPPHADEQTTHRHRRATVATLVVIAAGVITFLVLQTRPLETAFTWSMVTGPEGPLNLDTLVATESRYALLSGVTRDGVILWWSKDALRWENRHMEGSPTQIAAADEVLFTYRGRQGSVLSVEGASWRAAGEVTLPAEPRSQQASGRPSVVLGENGMMIEMSIDGDIWWSPDRGGFEMVVESPSWGPGVEAPFRSRCRPPARSSPDTPPLIANDDMMAALVSANVAEPFGVWPVCRPVIMTSAEGDEWARYATDFDADAYVYDLDWRDGVFLAVGGYGIGEPALWASSDGLFWEDITFDIGESVDLYEVEAGGAGWVMLGRDVLKSEPVGWASADGGCWEPLVAPVAGSQAVVNDHGILLANPATSPDFWLATATGSVGACR